MFVEGTTITKVGKTSDFPKDANGNLRVIDLEGKTLMPGLIEGHFHISFWGVRELPDLDLKLPAERTTVYSVKNAELALRCGYTGVASAGALHRIDVTIRDMIDEGIIPGPRMAVFRARHLRHLRDARLEPVVLEARNGRARHLRRRCRRGSQSRPAEHQGRL